MFNTEFAPPVLGGDKLPLKKGDLVRYAQPSAQPEGGPYYTVQDVSPQEVTITAAVNTLNKAHEEKRTKFYTNKTAGKTWDVRPNELYHASWAEALA